MARQVYDDASAVHDWRCNTRLMRVLGKTTDFDPGSLRTAWLLVATLACIFVAWASPLAAAEAAHRSSWLDAMPDSVLSLFGTAGGSGSVDPLDQAHRLIVKSDARPPALVLAAAVSAEGHWTFVNQAGQRYTAANERELARVYTSLAPAIEGRPGPVVIYVTEASAARHPEHLRQLPADARLRLVSGGTSYPLQGFGPAKARRWFVEVRPNVLVRPGADTPFGDAVWHLQRPLGQLGLRVIGLDPDGPDTFAPLGRMKDGAPVVDVVNPASLASAITTLRGQTALLTGRIEGRNRLVYRTSTGSERSLDLRAVRTAAARANVNLLRVDAPAPRQPGTRNWLWLRIEVAGLEDALRQPTFGDFLGKLGGDGEQLFVDIQTLGDGRVLLSVMPLRAGAMDREPGTYDSVLAELGSEVAGNVRAHAIDADLMARDRVRELRRRVVPGVPSWMQFGFAGFLALGVLGLPVALRWWRRIWPSEQRQNYAGRGGYEAARIVRWVAFGTLFLPVVGVPALVWGLIDFARWLIAGKRAGADATRSSG